MSLPPDQRGAFERLEAAAAALAFLAIVLLAALFALQRFSDSDVFWHIRTGQWILEEGRIPRTDPFGEMTSGEPWLDVAWGAQAVAAGIVAWTGLTGLQLCAIGLVAGTLLALGGAFALTPAVLAAALLFTLTAWQRFLVRPDLLSMPLTMAALVVVDGLPKRPRSSMIALAALTAVWANAHGAFVLVPALVAAAAAGALISGKRQVSFKTHGYALLLSGAAAMVNPYGHRVYTSLWPYLRSLLAATGILAQTRGLGVSEWTPTWRVMLTDPIFPEIPFLLLVGLLALSFLRLPSRGSLRRAACMCLLLALALTAVRNLLPFAAGALVIVSLNERDRLARRMARETGPAEPTLSRVALRLAAPALVTVITCSQIGAVITDRFYVDRDLPNRTGIGPNLELSPEGAVQWLAAHRPPGRMFNNYNSGSYLLYRLYPHVRTYIDGRLDITALAQEIDRAIRDPSAFEALVQRDGIGTIVLIHPSPESIHLLPALTRDPRWTMIFRDANTTIHVRSHRIPAVPREPPLALAPPIDPAAQRLNAWLERYKKYRLPAWELTDAFVSGILGDTEREVAAYRRALDRAPGDPVALAMLQKLAAPAN